MNLEEFADERYRVQKYLFEITPVEHEGYVKQIMSPWFTGIAPKKAAQYGTACWERMGPRALLVDINACFYRWENLYNKGHWEPEDYSAMENALVDSFGYCVMLAVISHCLPSPEMFKKATPVVLNEVLLHDYWQEQSAWWSRGVGLAFQMNYNMWRSVR